MKDILDASTDWQQQRRQLTIRAAWLYYIGGHTQDQIAARLKLSRPAVQRLIARTVEEGIVKFRIDHPLADCLELASRLAGHYGLTYAEVVPASGGNDGLNGIAIAAANRIETHLAAREPLTIAIATGRALRAAVSQVQRMERPQHTIVSMIGNISHDGRASRYDVVMRLAERAGAACYPMLAPVVTRTAAECRVLLEQPAVQTIHRLAGQARAAFVGIGHLDDDAPLFVDGFITRDELKMLRDDKAVGELCGWFFDADGKILKTALHDRQVAVPLGALPAGVLTGVAVGRHKIAAIAGALRGRLVSELITDEQTARELLKPGTSRK
ncbi:MAG: sugar-binding transcriptional regulator [Opitutaceae bacterium]|jgi:DNA-binding transcriptional regulator LsrR (DeoR family)|nr:sugar-binding transcriptional regulator [Opitutaceae bacterium]